MSERLNHDLYLVTEGETWGEEPEVIGVYRESELAHVFDQLARHRTEAGEDVTKIRAWKLTDARIEPRGYQVVGLPGRQEPPR